MNKYYARWQHDSAIENFLLRLYWLDLVTTDTYQITLWVLYQQGEKAMCDEEHKF